MLIMYEFIDDILKIKAKDCSYFFDPDTLLIFSKNKTILQDEKIVEDYQNKKKTFPKEKKSQLIKNWVNSSRVALELHVTNQCNLRCKYCYVSEECDKERSHEMSEEVIEKALVFTLKNFPNVELLRLSLWGGEPMLFREKFLFVVEKAKEIFKNKKISFSFSTNGTIMDEEMIDFLIKNQFSLQVSLDGFENDQNFLRPTFQGKGTYKTVMENLSYWKKKNIKMPAIRSTITPYNLDLTNLYLFFKKNGFEKTKFCLCTSLENDLAIKEEHLPILFQNLEILAEQYLQDLIDQKNEEAFHFVLFEKYLKILHVGKKQLSYCAAGRYLFTVSPDGDLYFCHRFVGNKEYKIGDLDNGFLAEKDISTTLLPSNLEKDPNCKSCFARYLCGGGCVHESYSGFNKISCAFKRKLFYSIIWIYCELQTKHPHVLAKWDQKKSCCK
jgi:uncharacterized protein